MKPGNNSPRGGKDPRTLTGNSEMNSFLWGADAAERVAARNALADMKAQITLNEQQNEAKYSLFPRTKKAALTDSPDLLVLCDIVEGVIRKTHFTCHYLVEHCLAKTLKPVVHGYCHEYSQYMDQSCSEIKRSMELSMASLVLVFHGIKQMLKQKDDLTERATSLAQTLEVMNRSLISSDNTKEMDIDMMANIPDHIKAEMEERLAIEKYRADEYSLQLQSVTSRKAPLLVITQPDDDEADEDEGRQAKPQPPITPKSSRQHQHQQGFSVKSPRGHPTPASASPRARKVDAAAKTPRQLPPGYKTQEQIDAEKQELSIKDNYLNHIATSSKSNEAVKAQYELEKGYMSKHHIATLEQQIKKMQRELEKAKRDAMTPNEIQQAAMARKLKAGSKAVTLWTMSKEEACAVRLQKNVKLFLRRLRKRKAQENFCAKQIQAVVHNYLVSARARRGLDRWYAERWSRLVLSWYFLKLIRRRKAKLRAIRLLQSTIKRKLFAWRLRAASRCIRKALTMSMNSFVDDMLQRLDNRMRRVEKALELTDPTLAAMALKDKILSYSDRSLVNKPRSHSRSVALINDAIIALRRPSEQFRKRLQIVENKSTAIKVAVSSVLRTHMLNGKLDALEPPSDALRPTTAQKSPATNARHASTRPSTSVDIDIGDDDKGVGTASGTNPAHRKASLARTLSPGKLVPAGAAGGALEDGDVQHDTANNIDDNNDNDDDKDNNNNADDNDDDSDYDLIEDSIDIRRNLLKKLLTQGSSTVSELSEYRETDEKAAYQRYVAQGSAVSALRLVEKVEKLQAKSSLVRYQERICSTDLDATKTLIRTTANQSGPQSQSRPATRSQVGDTCNDGTRSEGCALFTVDSKCSAGIISMKTIQNVWESCRPRGSWLFTRSLQGYCHHSGLDILLRDQLPDKQTCKQQPAAVSKHQPSAGSMRSVPVEDVARMWSGHLLSRASQLHTTDQSTNTIKAVTKDSEMNTMNNMEELEAQLQELDKLHYLPQDLRVQFDFSDIDGNDQVVKRPVSTRPAPQLELATPLSAPLVYSELLSRLHIQISSFGDLSLRSATEIKPRSWLQTTCSSILAHLATVLKYRTGINMSFSLLEPAGFGPFGSSCELSAPITEGSYSSMISLCSNLHIADNRPRHENTRIHAAKAIASNAYEPLFTGKSMITNEPNPHLYSGLAVVDGCDCVMQSLRLHIASEAEAATGDVDTMTDTQTTHQVRDCILDMISTANFCLVDPYGLHAEANNTNISASYLLQVLSAPASRGSGSSSALSPAATFVVHAMRLCDCIHSQWHSRICRVLVVQSKRQEGETAVTTATVNDAVDNDVVVPSQSEYEQLMQELRAWTIINYETPAADLDYNEDLNHANSSNSEIPSAISLSVAVSMYQYLVLGLGVSDWHSTESILRLILPQGDEQIRSLEVEMLIAVLSLAGFDRTVKPHNGQQRVVFVKVSNKSQISLNKRLNQVNEAAVAVIHRLQAPIGASDIGNNITAIDVKDILAYILVTSLRLRCPELADGLLSNRSASRGRSALRSNETPAPGNVTAGSRKASVGLVATLPVMERHAISSLRELAKYVERNHIDDSELAKHTASMTLYDYQQFLKLRQQIAEEDAKQCSPRGLHTPNKLIEQQNRSETLKQRHQPEMWMPDGDIRRLSHSDLASISICSYSFILLLLQYHLEQARAQLFILGINRIYRSLDPRLADMISVTNFVEFVRIYAHRPMTTKDITNIYQFSVRRVAELLVATTKDIDNDWESLLGRIFCLDADLESDAQQSGSVMSFQSFVYALLYMIIEDIIDPQCLQPCMR